MKEKMEARDELNLISLAQEYADEDKARGLLESLLWPDGPVCPHCQNHKEKAIYKLNPKAGSKTRKGVYKCGACRKQFTVTVGTILEDSHIKISKWLMAFFILCSSKKSISALQLSRMLKLGYQAAWFMAHRIRFAVGQEMPLYRLLKGVVEADETFVGGKGRRNTKFFRQTPVMALIEQGGQMRTRILPNVSQRNIGNALRDCVSKDAVLCTDEHLGYRRPGKQFKAHHTVVHSKYEYILKTPDGISAGTNRCESFFSLLKRGVHGAWHCVSREHLHRYANEFAFRWNTRELTDGERMETAVGLASGKRLTYRQVI
ncbi:MAG TPA: IS1595 family transposase [Candidatus Sulfopaludibacter sp.]|nr:IS1595 family transposase [Candidatus Sulfopaludibacter sp.]